MSRSAEIIKNRIYKLNIELYQQINLKPIFERFSHRLLDIFLFLLKLLQQKEKILSHRISQAHAESWYRVSSVHKMPINTDQWWHARRSTVYFKNVGGRERVMAYWDIKRKPVAFASEVVGSISQMRWKMMKRNIFSSALMVQILSRAWIIDGILV